MSGLKYKEFLFYIIETDEDFFLHLGNQLYPGFRHHRVLKILTVDEPNDYISFLGAINKLQYAASLKAFRDTVKVKQKITINPN